MPEPSEKNKVIRNEDRGVTIKTIGDVTIEEWDNGKTVRTSPNGEVLITGEPGKEYTTITHDGEGTFTTGVHYDDGRVETTTETQDGFRDTVANDGTEKLEQPGDDRIYEKDSEGNWTFHDPNEAPPTNEPQTNDESHVEVEFGPIEIIAIVPDDNPPAEQSPASSTDGSSGHNEGTGGGGPENESGGGTEGGDGHDDGAVVGGGGGVSGGGGGDEDEFHEHLD